MEKYVNGRQAKPDEEKSDNEKYQTPNTLLVENGLLKQARGG